MNFALRKGETIAIVGESGSGKSVTARAVMRLLSKRATIAKGASIIIDGQDVLKLPEREMRKLRGSRVSMIFQEPMSSLNPVYTVGSQICEVIHLHNKISRKDGNGPGAGTAAGSADSRTGIAPQAISAPIVRRPAPARDDRHGAWPTAPTS